MKKSAVVFLTVAFAFVCLAMSGCEDKNASKKRKPEFVSGGAESIQPKAAPALCGGMPAQTGKTDQGARKNNSSPPKEFQRGRGKVETVKAKGSV